MMNGGNGEDEYKNKLLHDVVHLTMIDQTYDPLNVIERNETN